MKIIFKSTTWFITMFILSIILFIVNIKNKQFMRFNEIIIYIIIISAVFTICLIMIYFTIKKIMNDNFGLIEIFDTRYSIFNHIKKYIKPNTQLDICGFGLRYFRDSQIESIKKILDDGGRIRILTVNPLSKVVQQREKDLNLISGTIRQEIFNLIEWIILLKKEYNTRIQLRIYDSLPLDFYMKINNNIYTGPYLVGVKSEGTITSKFIKGYKGYDKYNILFNNIWNKKGTLRIEDWIEFNNSERDML